ncbi:hypothetical protein [Gloeothece verrucosa]|uniref:Lipoprotein n=1 Tax=Gloeothece verrucosa (strain PCC 7822) TaxID=497965 RepID=E0UFW3_GLOV7|nr:hypothetical protein [Gloeothece verrucosa]ADN14346.1 hypothetical protein Cyan7822_2370 [Gloeothece verrucosa PCC 7822]
MKIKKPVSLYRVIAVFVAGLFLFVLTACGTSSKVLATNAPTSRSNKPADVMQPSDIPQRQDVSGVNEKAETLINGSRQNLERHGVYHGNDKPLLPKKDISDIAGDVQDKAGQGIKDLRENIENSAQEAASALKGAAKNARTAADDVSGKAQRAADQARYRTFDND